MEHVSLDDSEVPPPFGDLVRRLIADITAYLDAERQVYSMQARIARRGVGWIALYAFGAVVMAQGAMIAFVVGILLTLSPLIGPPWATVVILVICSFITAFFIWRIRTRLRLVKLAWRRRHDT